MSDFEMPMAAITRLIKEGQIGDQKLIISQDVKKAFSQISGFFALYLFSTANDISREHKRKKVTEQDVFQALKELGFDKYVDQLKDFMKNYNENEDEVKKLMNKKRKLDGGADVPDSKRLRKENEDDEEMEDDDLQIVDLQGE